MLIIINVSPQNALVHDFQRKLLRHKYKRIKGHDFECMNVLNKRNKDEILYKYTESTTMLMLNWAYEVALMFLFSLFASYCPYYVKSYGMQQLEFSFLLFALLFIVIAVATISINWMKISFCLYVKQHAKKSTLLYYLFG